MSWREFSTETAETALLTDLQCNRFWSVPGMCLLSNAFPTNYSALLKQLSPLYSVDYHQQRCIRASATIQCVEFTSERSSNLPNMVKCDSGWHRMISLFRIWRRWWNLLNEVCVFSMNLHSIMEAKAVQDRRVGSEQFDKFDRDLTPRLTPRLIQRFHVEKLICNEQQTTYNCSLWLIERVWALASGWQITHFTTATFNWKLMGEATLFLLLILLLIESDKRNGFKVAPNSAAFHLATLDPQLFYFKSPHCL